MEILNPTAGKGPGTAPNDATPPGPEETLAELTRCLSEAHAVRARFHLGRGETGKALSDLDDALRLDPENAEALQLRGVVERQPGQNHPAAAAPAGSQGGPAIDGGLRPQTRFESGYQVMARYPDKPGGTDDLLETSFPHTPRGFLEAVEYARRMCSDESSRERELLYDAYKTGGEEFDTVVVEFRSLTREVHLERFVEEDEPIGE